MILLGLFAWAGGERVSAQSDTRHTTLLVTTTIYEWWLIRWATNEIVCVVPVEHEGLPTAEEVQKSCGATIYSEWVSTTSCKQLVKGGQDPSVCAGLYLHLASVLPAQQKEVIVNLPSAEVFVNLEGCDPKPPENLCPTIPNLLIIGKEPLPNERILAIHGAYDGLPFTCTAAQCIVPLHPTLLRGSTIEFWADSSFGDSTQHYTAQVRVVDSGVAAAPGGSGWYVDVVSSQWIGPPLTSCASIWQAFPSLGGPPTWLDTPDSSTLLASELPYYYLAGRLIAQGQVPDAADCPSGGLMPNGYADACGLEKARLQILPWQNQFDQQILDVAIDTGVPAQLMKNLFAQESQFWPGVFRVPYEFGLGQITDNGADSILFWNPSFYEQFCPLVLAEDTCAKGYLKLTPDQQALLRGALAQTADPSCATCPAGINLENVHFSINLFAQTLVANCAQVNQTIQTATDGMVAGMVSTYEDLWRFTVANYHAGPGCVSFAIHQAWQNTGMLTWDEVSARLTEPCKGVVPYVEKITGR